MTIRLFAFVIALGTLALGSAAEAASTVTSAPASGHPRQVVTVSGTGFGTSEAIDVYFDTVDTLLLVSSSGAFKGSVTIPTTASPGLHYVTAIGRQSGSAAQATLNVTTAWAEPGFGAAHLGLNPYENTLSPATVPSLGILWSVATSSGGGTPAIAGNRVFVGTNQGVKALAPATGAVLWSKVTTDSFAASPAVVAGVVYIGSLNNHTMYALNGATGAQLWSKSLASSVYSSAVVVNGIVYVGCYDKTVYALQASTGNTLWSYATGGPVVSSPAVVGGQVYIGSDDNALYALNATTGALVWSYTTGGQVESSPAVANGVVYVGSDDGKVYAVSAASGVLLWSTTAGGAVYGAPAVAGGVVYAGSSGSSLYALNARTGATRWTFATGGLVRGAVVADGVVYVTAQDNLLYELDAGTGAVLGSAVTGSTYFGTPSVSDGIVYVSASTTGSTYAFAPQAGTDAIAARRASGAPYPSSLHPDPTLRVSNAIPPPSGMKAAPEDGPE